MNNKDYIMSENKNGEYIGIELLSANDNGEELVYGSKDNRISNSLDNALDIVLDFMSTINNKLTESGTKKAEVEFGINFDISTGSILSPIISQSTEATIKVKLSWENCNEST